MTRPTWLFREVVPSHGLRDHKSFSFDQLRLDNFAIVKLSHGYGDVSRLRVPSFASRPRDQSKIPGFKAQSSGACPVPTLEPWTLDLGLQTRGHQSARVPSRCPVPSRNEPGLGSRFPLGESVCCRLWTLDKKGQSPDADNSFFIRTRLVPPVAHGFIELDEVWPSSARQPDGSFILPEEIRSQNPVFLGAQKQLQRFLMKTT